MTGFGPEAVRDLTSKEIEQAVAEMRRHQRDGGRCVTCGEGVRCSVAHVARIRLLLGGVDPEQALLDYPAQR
jgi:diaminopimelate epimerase